MRSLFSSLLILLMALPATAQVRPMGFEVSGYGGVWEGDAVYESAATNGGRIRFNLTKLFGIETTLGVVDTRSIERPQAGVAVSEDTTLSLFGANAVLHLADGKLVPFMTGGVGFVGDGENYFASNAGAGAVYHITDLIGVRAEARGWFSGDAPATDRFHHLAFTGGLVIKFLGNSDRDKDGIQDRDDSCPDEPEDRDEFEDTDGCPDPDNDKDGILDGDDKCPLEAEDKDGDADEDGCPEDDPPPPPPPVVIDTDKDGIPDKTDRCPMQAETKNGVEDEDGCPESVVIITRAKIEIKDKVFFETDKAIIKAASYELLNTVAQVMNAHAFIESVEVQGHTDDRGTDEYNLDLSQRRADAVKTYLAETGKVDAGRLTAKGFGKSKPLQEGEDEAAWSQNRRVEFIITKEAPDVPKVKYVPIKPKAADAKPEAVETKADPKPEAAEKPVEPQADAEEKPAEEKPAEAKPETAEKPAAPEPKPEGDK
jgi:outer membrane protein OmpA-like peptidoglycan-associated protein